MAVLHHLGDIADDLNEIGTEISWVGGGVSNALDSGDSGEELKELAEGDAAFGKVFAVGVDGLAQKGDFFSAEFGEASDFGDDVFGGAGTFASAGGGDDAECAEFIAAVLDGDEGFDFSRAFEVALGDLGDDDAFSFGEVESGLESFALEGFFDKSRDFADLGGTDDEINEGVFLANFFSAKLGHASGDADDDFGSVCFDDIEFSEEGEGFVFGFSADGASVKEDDLSFSPVGGGFKAQFLEIEGHLFAVFFIHLATPGLDKVGASLCLWCGGFCARLKESDVAHFSITGSKWYLGEWIRLSPRWGGVQGRIILV